MIVGSKNHSLTTLQPGQSMGTWVRFGILGFFRLARILLEDLVSFYRVLNYTEC